MYQVHSPDFGTYTLCTSCVEKHKPKFSNAEFLSVVKLEDADHIRCDSNVYAEMGSDLIF
jgi:hypothetical protein